MSLVKLADLQEQKPAQYSTVSVSMDTLGGFEAMQRIAKLFSSSSIVPQAYRGNLPNCFIAVDMAMRMGANPLLVMQNLYVVHGNPAWSAQFLIATFNKSGRFSAIRYEMSGKEGTDSWGYRANATEISSGEVLQWPLITIGMAKKEGWYHKSNSKWPTMPEMMLRYRAAAWFVRAYAPEIAMGLQTIEEIKDATVTIEAQTLEEVAAIEEPKTNGRKKKAGPEESPKEEANGRNEAGLLEDEEPFECVKEIEDGKPKMVTTQDCANCPDMPGCPNRYSGPPEDVDNEGQPLLYKDTTCRYPD